MDKYTVAKIGIHGAKATVLESNDITMGLTGAVVQLIYDDDLWQGMRKEVTFRGTKKVDVLTDENVVELPWEVTTAKNVTVSIGITGVDADEKTIIPTVWATIGAVKDSPYGAYPAPGEPVPPEWAQVLEMIGDLRNLNTVDKSNLVAAVNEAMSNSGGGNGDGAGGYYTPIVTQPTANTMQISFTPSVATMPAVEPVTITLPGSDSGQNINPVAKTEDMTQPVGVDADGRLWVAPIGGGSGGDTPVVPGSHSIFWDLVNVTSSNNIVSISDGESLIAVLTPEEGYTLGDVIVTMGGEALTGVWNADTATVTIASVTGDVVISCAGVEIVVIDTTPVVENDNVECAENGQFKNNDKTFVTEFFYFPETLQVSSDTYTLVYSTPKKQDENPIGTPKLQCFNDDTYVTYWSQVFAVIGVDSSYEKKSVFSGGYGTINKFRMTIFKSCANVSYAYWKETGDILFAGVDSPYYGMTNINGGVNASAVMSFDDDVAQNYAVATASILGDEPETNTNTAYGISASLAAVITEAKNEWMIEYGGDYRKIPIIVSCDQHGRRNPGIFNFIGKTFSLHDVSKVMNLGDTCSGEWKDSDLNRPLLSCATLESWCESIKAIPFSKRLDVYGNHDAWYYDGYSVEGNPIGTRYPSTMHHLDQYFRNIYARRNNNHGWGAIYDDYFNVKYVIVTGFEFKDGGAGQKIRTAQMAWLIEELEKNDGYDVVIVSHVPLRVDPAQMITPTADSYADGVYHVSELDTDALFAARKTGGTGTVIDSDGVEHTYDFTNCQNPILCSLHGHTHEDVYLYLNDSLLVNAFDWFDDNTFFLVLIDRVNRQLNVWKIETTEGVPSYQNYQIPLDKPTE